MHQNLKLNVTTTNLTTENFLGASTEAQPCAESDSAEAQPCAESSWHACVVVRQNKFLIVTAYRRSDN